MPEHRMAAKPELLSPAGSIESLTAAVKYGADAVYIGGRSFGARAYADNPDEKELLEALDLVHLAGKRLYLTVNTLMREEELEKDLYSFLEPYYRRGLDGVIVQDAGAVSFIRKAFPDLPVHASTQMAVTGTEAVRLLAGLGITRVVPARELSLDELREIADTGMEVECFVHGAMCYSYSGVCLMSSLIGGRSGNRGRCAGICRLPFSEYTAGKRSRDIYPMNMKDLCALELLPQLIGAGICSFKIEGRMKRPEYTARLTEIYRKYIDLAVEGKGNYRVDPEDLTSISSLFNRDGFTDGYFFRHNGSGMIAVRNRKETDEKGMRSAAAQKSYKQIAEQLGRKEIRRPCDGELYLVPGEPARLSLCCGGVTAEVTGDTVQEARSQPLPEERILAQMKKTGDLPLAIRALQIHMNPDAPVFMPVGALNRLRRDAISALAGKILKSYNRGEGTDPSDDTEATEKDTGFRPDGVKSSGRKLRHPLLFRVQAETEEQAFVLAEYRDDRISGYYLPVSFAGTECAGKLENLQQKPVFFVLPHITRADSEALLTEQIRRALAGRYTGGFLVRDYEGLALVRGIAPDARVIADHSLYMFNHRAQEVFRSLGVSAGTVPLELNAAQIMRRDNSSSELIVYGRAPMMVSAQCVRKTLHGCDRSDRTILLADRKNAVFPVRCFCSECTNVVYNSRVTSLAGEMETVRRLGCAGLRICLTTENARQSREALDLFLQDSQNGGTGSDETTKGHFRRGVL